MININLLRDIFYRKNSTPSPLFFLCQHLRYAQQHKFTPMYIHSFFFF